MRARVLGVLLLATLVGVGGGLVAGWGVDRADQPGATGGTASPLPAASPSVPVDPPRTQPPFAADIDYPALEPGLALRYLRMGNSQQTWRVPVPKGWVASDVDTGEPVPRSEWSGYDELRFRPADEPDEGGYSLRVKTINVRLTPAAMVAAKLVGLRDIDVVDRLEQDQQTLKFTYRTSSDRLRYNYFAWFAAPFSSEATLEMSVVGRERDVPGLDALFAAFFSTLRAVD